MFIAMNRFKVAKGQEDAFEDIWRSRRTRLDEMPGFVAFHLLRGPEREDHTLYSSHTTWSDRDDFTAWTQSEQFRESHRNAGKNKGVYLGHPEFEGFEAVLSQENPAPVRAAAE
jgi:heme-degrading monooxygenase HmoA